MTDRTVTELPSLLPLYAKAVLTGPRRSSSSSLSDLTFSASEQRVDPDQLAAYQRLCGYPVGDQLPPTYLHLLTFGLSVARMTEADFPFPLLGLVHVHNRIEVHRTVRADEPVSVRAWAADLRPHPAGRQVDLVSEASVAGEVVWRECSTYLRRLPKPPAATGATHVAPSGHHPPDEQHAHGEQEAPRSAGERPSVAARWAVPADIGRQYAALSGDRNPIHLYPLTARIFGFPRAIAHGMWVLARTLSSVQNRLPASFVVEASFNKPVLLPSAVELDSVRTEAGWSLTLHGARSATPHLTLTIAG